MFYVCLCAAGIVFCNPVVSQRSIRALAILFEFGGCILVVVGEWSLVCDAYRFSFAWIVAGLSSTSRFIDGE
jgi:hypothetical protein